MKSEFSLTKLLALLIVAGSLMCGNAATAQVRLEIPDMPQMPALDLGVIMDGTMFSSGGNMSVQMSIENGVKKIRADENGVKTYIEEDSDGIIVKITTQYGPENMDVLQEEYPDLYMSMKDFPTETEDAEEVEVSVGITKKYEAATPAELQEKHPEVFESYKKYSNGNSNSMQIFRGRFGRELIMPEIRIAPEMQGIEFDDVRIHDDEDGTQEDAQKQEPKKEDKDT